MGAGVTGMITGGSRCWEGDNQVENVFEMTTVEDKWRKDSGQMEKTLEMIKGKRRWRKEEAGVNKVITRWRRF